MKEIVVEILVPHTGNAHTYVYKYMYIYIYMYIIKYIYIYIHHVVSMFVYKHVPYVHNQMNVSYRYPIIGGHRQAAQDHRTRLM